MRGREADERVLDDLLGVVEQLAHGGGGDRGHVRSSHLAAVTTPVSGVVTASLIGRVTRARLGEDVVGEGRQRRRRRGRAGRRPGSSWAQCVTPPPKAETSSGPKARAGFSEAPVIGPMTMMIAIDDAADHDAGEVVRATCESTIPRIANISMNVPMPSAKIA